jgi:hypothetical protein
MSKIKTLNSDRPSRPSRIARPGGPARRRHGRAPQSTHTHPPLAPSDRPGRRARPRGPERDRRRTHPRGGVRRRGGIEAESPRHERERERKRERERSLSSPLQHRIASPIIRRPWGARFPCPPFLPCVPLPPPHFLSSPPTHSIPRSRAGGATAEPLTAAISLFDSATRFTATPRGRWEERSL